MSEPSDAFTRDRLLWQAQVLADRGMTLLALHVALALGQHVSRQTGEAWPSQARLCEMLQASRRGVQGAIEQLVSRGHLKVIPAANRKGGNRYRPLLSGGVERVPHAHDGAHETGSHANEDAHERGPHAHDGAHETGSHAQIAAGFMRTGVRPELFERELSDRESISRASKPKPRKRAIKPGVSDTDFDTTYQMYPRHVAKDAARNAYIAAIGRGAQPAEILAGVQRYAAERAGQDQKFTAHMSTWLRAGRWSDAPASPQPLSNQSRLHRQERFSALDFAMARMEAEDD